MRRLLRHTAGHRAPLRIGGEVAVGGRQAVGLLMQNASSSSTAVQGAGKRREVDSDMPEIEGKASCAWGIISFAITAS